MPLPCPSWSAFHFCSSQFQLICWELGNCFRKGQEGFKGHQRRRTRRHWNSQETRRDEDLGRHSNRSCTFSLSSCSYAYISLQFYLWRIVSVSSSTDVIINAARMLQDVSKVIQTIDFLVLLTFLKGHGLLF